MIVSVVETFCFNAILGILQRVTGIVSWPQRLRSAVVRGGEEWLLVVGLVVLSISVRHPAIVRLYVVELRTWNGPFELVPWTCWGWIHRACCQRNVLYTVLVSRCVFWLRRDSWSHPVIICWSIEPCLFSPEDSSRRIFARSSSMEQPSRSLARSIDEV